MYLYIWGDLLVDTAIQQLVVGRIRGDRARRSFDGSQSDRLFLEASWNSWTVWHFPLTLTSPDNQIRHRKFM